MIHDASGLDALAAIVPEIILLIFAAVCFLLDHAPERRKPCAGIAATAILFTMILLPVYWGKGVSGFGGLILRDDFSLFMSLLIGICVVLAILYSREYLRQRQENVAEYYGCMLTAVLGMNIVTAATDLMVVFLGMEILALSLYILVGFFKHLREGMEAALKYFLLGAFSSAVFLFGVACMYGVFGVTEIAAVGSLQTIMPGTLPLFAAAVALVYGGIGFKIAAVPFHMWAPDAYEGAPVSVASLLSAAPKIAALAVFLRIGAEVSGFSPDMVTAFVTVMALASMVVGNLAALWQSGLVRMLAYSGIAQIGYMLIAFQALPRGGSALVFYLCVYTIMNMGAFGIAAHLAARRDAILRIEDMSGLAARSPLLALSMSVFMISLIGIPPTGGFVAKFYIFAVGIEAGRLGTVLVAVIMSVASAYYYLRVIVYMYMHGEAGNSGAVPSPAARAFSIGMLLLAGVTVILGVVPGSVLSLASAVAAGLF